MGTLLLEATIKTLVAHGAPQVVLSAAAKNEAAQRLFAREGFRRTMVEMTREVDRAEPSGTGGNETEP